MEKIEKVQVGQLRVWKDDWSLFNDVSQAFLIVRINKDIISYVYPLEQDNYAYTMEEYTIDVDSILISDIE